jgi:hypothetical protein
MMPSFVLIVTNKFMKLISWLKNIIALVRAMWILLVVVRRDCFPMLIQELLNLQVGVLI